MKAKIHKFEQNGEYILLDINSGAVHVIDKMIYDMMDIFDGENDGEVLEKLSGSYPKADLEEALAELHELMEAGELFAPDIDVNSNPSNPYKIQQILDIEGVFKYN